MKCLQLTQVTNDQTYYSTSLQLSDSQLKMWFWHTLSLKQESILNSCFSFQHSTFVQKQNIKDSSSHSLGINWSFRQAIRK